MLPQQNEHGVKKPRITNVKVVSIEKRKDTKNLEFFLSVGWSNGDTRTIARQYSMFFDLLGGIKMIFQDVHGVVIPDLPVPKFHVKVLFSSLAKKESRAIEEFCQKLIDLPPAISQSDIIEKFFSEWGTDLVNKESKTKNAIPVSRPATHDVDRADDSMVERYRAMASYQALTSGEMQMTENEILTVIEKNRTGWWLVTNDKGQHGFAPATFLEPVDRETHNEAEEWISYDGESRFWVAIESYAAQSEDEVSYKKGDKVEVISTSNVGWWKVRFKGKVGVTPASNLVPIQTTEDSVFDNPVYDYGPIERRTSFTGMGSIYASIRNPPPRRDSSKKDIPPVNEPVKDATLAYASVYVTKDAFLTSSPDEQSTRNEEEEDLYSKVIPKHLRSPKTNNSRKNNTEAIYDEVHNEGPPPIPLCFVDETATLARKRDEQVEKEPQRRKSTAELNTPDSRRHGYLNVGLRDGTQDGGTNLYRAITEYQVPMDRHDDLPLPAGCMVRALTKDGTFFFVSTLDNPPKKGWVPEYVLENVQAKSSSGHRRSRSLGDILSDSLQSQPEVSVTFNLKDIRERAPAIVPRQPRRYFSFDTSTNSMDDQHVDIKNEYRDSEELASKIQSLKLSTLNETWFHGKMNRQSCEEHMQMSARELDFMIRESTQRFASYVLSVMFAKKVRHFPIETTPSKKFVIGRHAFDSLPAIVDFFKKNPLFYTQHKKPVSLGQPFVLF